MRAADLDLEVVPAAGRHGDPASDDRGRLVDVAPVDGEDAGTARCSTPATAPLSVLTTRTRTALPGGGVDEDVARPRR